jgi:predicted Zn finger-like uncharacterized protein
VILTCPECDTKYRYDERRFDDAESKKVKCTACGFLFEVMNPAVEATESGIGKRKMEPESKAVEPPEDPDLSSPIAPLPSDSRYSLAVIAGMQAGSVFQINKPRVLIGRGSAMDIQLRDSEVSRRHAALEIRDPNVTLTDLGATNGTWVNAARIDSAALDHQDEFTLGSTTLMLIVTPVRPQH